MTVPTYCHLRSTRIRWIVLPPSNQSVSSSLFLSSTQPHSLLLVTFVHAKRKMENRSESRDNHLAADDTTVTLTERRQRGKRRKTKSSRGQLRKVWNESTRTTLEASGKATKSQLLLNYEIAQTHQFGFPHVFKSGHNSFQHIWSNEGRQLAMTNTNGV